MGRIRAHAAVVIVAAVLLAGAGCASTPQASIGRDAEAKAFLSSPGSSTVYVYRTDFGNEESDAVLWLDGRLIGATLPRTFFRINVEPGVHTLNGSFYDLGKIDFETRPGELYFISLSASTGHSMFRLEPQDKARAALTACCALMENWAPGQRPLLR
jgi:hypothetical protein